MKKYFLKSANFLGSIIFMLFVLITGYFIVSNYYSTKRLIQGDNLNRLEAIASTLSIHVDGDEYLSLLKRHQNKDDITQIKQDSVYQKIHSFLKKGQYINNINTDVYTLLYDSLDIKPSIRFGVTSGENPYYRHQYTNFPPELLDHFTTGAQIKPYSDNNGKWISAFAPIKTKDGQIVGVVQVDQEFDDLIAKVREKSWKNLLISSFVSLIFLYVLSIIAKEEKRKKTEIENAYEQVIFQKKRIQDSINYAENIQKAIIPSFEILEKYGIKSACIYKPKDVVSGDFPWIFEYGKKVFIATVDCTGHGVPGAMMSFVGYFLLNHITSTTESSAAHILTELNIAVRKTLKQDNDGSLSNDGMDIGLMIIDKTKNVICYAGARRPLYTSLSTGEFNIIKGTSKSIGGKIIKKLEERQFTDNCITYNTGDRFFMFSDGVPDQFNEQWTKKFSNARIRTVIRENSTSSLNETVQLLEEKLMTWMGVGEQTDDILFIGLEL